MSSPLLEPIFNKFEPLAKNHPALVGELETVVARTGTNIPPDRMFLMKASEKTNGLNAYVTGIGATKRIVVWDTTAGRIPDDEILFIFGHESGHYVLNHIPKELAGMAARPVLRLLGLRRLCRLAGAPLRRALAACRASTLQPLRSPAAPASSCCSSPSPLAGFMLQPAANTFSRHFEHQADVYGQEAIHGLVADPQKTAVAAFNHSAKPGLKTPTPAPSSSSGSTTTPAYKTRANFAAHYNPWANGGHGQFFDK